MDKLLECTRAFEKLLDVQYRIIIGRKGKKVEIVIGFSKLDFLLKIHSDHFDRFFHTDFR